MKVQDMKTEYKPSSNISIELETEVNSFVSVIAVDQKIAFNGTHDIDAEGLKKAFLKHQGGAEVYENGVFILTPNAMCSDTEKRLLAKEISHSVQQSTQQEVLGMNDQGDYDEITTGNNEIDSDLTQVIPTGNVIEENEEEDTIFRKYFPDVWIYDSFIANTSSISLHKQLPDSITTWKLSAFALHPELGLSIVEPQFLKASKVFYLEVNAPKIVRLGEIFEISVMPMSQNSSRQNGNMQVYLSDSLGNFKFVTAVPNNDECFNYSTSDVSAPYTIAMKSKQKFLIQMTKEGRQDLKMSAKIENQVVDVVEVTIKVIHDGIFEHKNIEIFIDLTQTEAISETIEIGVPSGAKLLRAGVSLHGNLLVPVLESFQER